MQRSKIDIDRADARAGGMSTSSGSGGASGMGASSSSSDASAMAHSTGSSGAGSDSLCLEKSSSWAWSAAASVTASRNSALLPARNGSYPVVHALFSSHKSVAARDAHSAEDALFMAKPSKEPSRTERARVAHARAKTKAQIRAKKTTSVISKKKSRERIIPITFFN